LGLVAQHEEELLHRVLTPFIEVPYVSKLSLFRLEFADFLPIVIWELLDHHMKDCSAQQT
jgi:hypothetical protein